MNNRVSAGILFLVIFLLAACSPTETATVATNELEETANTYEGQRIVVIDSYHEGYEWSDGIVSGVDSVLDVTNVEILLIRMDTKVNKDEEFRENAAESAYTEIMAFNPDVIIACDDNAQEYLIVPYFFESDIPVVFCGVNWDASPYGYPTEHITGMVEIELMEELTTYLEDFGGGSSIGVITGEASTEHKVHDFYNENFFDDSLVTYFVTNWDEFQTTFVEAQAAHDFLIIRNNSAIEEWPEDDVAIQFVQENTTIPTGSFQGFMASYVLMVIGKSSFEQGEWSATAALSILDGTLISDIPLAYNRQGNLILNLDMAEQLDFEFSPALLRSAEIYQADEE